MEWTAKSLSDALAEHLEKATQGLSTNEVIRPEDYKPWKWPPHPVSFDFPIPKDAWTGRAILEARGGQFEVEVATTEFGVFGRCHELLLESRGPHIAEMLTHMAFLAEPLLVRQERKASALGLTGRFTNPIRSVGPLGWLQLLFAEDRAIARDAQAEIETEGPALLFSASLMRILLEAKHPMRRQAQWAVLDILEDIQSYFPTPLEQDRAVDVILEFMDTTLDDYARAVFKAGVVLGGHVCSDYAADGVLKLFHSKNKIARRSAMHCVFHLAEWLPSRRSEITNALRAVGQTDPEPLLRHYATAMARDVEAGGVDHILEPKFDDEA